VKLLDLQAQYAARSQDFEAALLRVARSGIFLDGPEVASFERELALAQGESGCVICCASGSDALVLALKALGIRPGDEVVVPAFTFAATAEAVVHLGAIPVFADVEEDGLVSCATLEPCLTARTRAVVAVSLFGQVPALEDIGALLEARGIRWLEDAAQSYGAMRNGRRSGAFGPATTSFFPGKPLGAWGKGGAVLVDDPELAERIRALRNHGQRERGEHEEVGWNARMDEMQAAVLRVKLAMFPQELERRRALASVYQERLPGGARLLRQDPANLSSWSQLAVRLPRRDRVRDALAAVGIPTGVHYRRPLHLQPAFAPWRPSAGLPVAERLSREILSLPLHPWLSRDEVLEVCAGLETAMSTLDP
jgi:UDP-2-acetamido-2-deoxy-ribo-hexuluronate aminotransferase